MQIPFSRIHLASMLAYTFLRAWYCRWSRCRFVCRLWNCGGTTATQRARSATMPCTAVSASSPTWRTPAASQPCSTCRQVRAACASPCSMVFITCSLAFLSSNASSIPACAACAFLHQQLDVHVHLFAGIHIRLIQHPVQYPPSCIKIYASDDLSGGIQTVR